MAEQRLEPAGNHTLEEALDRFAEMLVDDERREASECERNPRFLVVWQSSGSILVFVRYDGGNEAFCDELYKTLVEHKNQPQPFAFSSSSSSTSPSVHSNPLPVYTVGRRFLTRDRCELLCEEVMPALGWKTLLFSSRPLLWNASLWKKCRSTLSVYMSAVCGRVGVALKSRFSDFAEEVAAVLDAHSYQIGAEYEWQFSQFFAWMHESCPDTVRTELSPLLLFLVFEHCFYDLVARGVSGVALKFYDRFCLLFSADPEYRSILFNLRGVATPELMKEDERCRRMRVAVSDLSAPPDSFVTAAMRARCILRPAKFVYPMTKNTFDFFESNLSLAVPPRIFLLLQTYFDFRPTF